MLLRRVYISSGRIALKIHVMVMAFMARMNVGLASSNAACSCADFMSGDPESWCPQYVLQTAGLNKEHVGSLAHFRLGAHDLRVCSGRWHRPPLPRSD
jgi:hypothetical protein